MPPAPRLEIALERDFGRRIGFLQLDAPIAQVGQLDLLAGHRTAYEVARRDHLEFAVEVAHLGFAPHSEQLVEPVHESVPPWAATLGRRTVHEIANRRRGVKAYPAKLAYLKPFAAKTGLL